MNWKRLEGCSLVLILRYSPGIRLEELRKTTKTLSQVSLSSDRDLKSGPTEYEAGVHSSFRLDFIGLHKLKQLSSLREMIHKYGDPWHITWHRGAYDTQNDLRC
jgi:hypothetical protein